VSAGTKMIHYNLKGGGGENQELIQWIFTCLFKSKVLLYTTWEIRRSSLYLMVQISKGHERLKVQG